MSCQQVHFPEQPAEEKSSSHTVLCDYENEAEQTFEGWGDDNNSVGHLENVKAFDEL